MPQLPLNEAELERLWQQAQTLEVGGDHPGALTAYSAMLQLYVEAGAPPKPYVQMRMIKNLCRLERLSPATLLLLELRQRLVAAQDGQGIFLVDLQRCQVALLSANGFRAARILARAADQHGPLGRVTPQHLHALDQRIRELSWPGAEPQELAQARAETRVILSRLWASSGLFEAAVEMLQRALQDTEWREVGLRRMELALLAAEHHLDQGDLATAERLIHPHLKQEEGERPLPRSDLFRWTLLRARVALLRGRFGEARDTLMSLVRDGRSAQLWELLHARWWLAQTLLYLNRTQEAEALIQESLALLPPGEPGKVWRGRFESLQEQLLRRRRAMGEELLRPFAPEEAPALHTKITEEWEYDGLDSAPPEGAREGAGPRRFRRSRERFAEDWARLANQLMMYLEDKDEDAVDLALGSLMRLAARTDSLRLSARTWYLQGIVAYYRGRYVEAKELFSRALDVARSRGLVFDVWQMLGFQAWTCARLKDAVGYAEHAAQARHLLGSMAAGLSAEDRMFFRLNKWSAQDEYLAALARSVPPRAPAGAGWFGRWRARRRSERALLEVYQALSRLTGWDIHEHLEGASTAEGHVSPREASTTLQVEEWIRTQLELPVQPGRRSQLWASLDASPWLLWRLPRSVAVLHFYVMGDRTLAFVLGHRRIELHTLPLSRERLWRCSIEALDKIARQATSRPPPPQAVDQSLRALSSALGLDSLLGSLPAHVDRLVIIPHDVLANLPFPALFAGENRVCERFACSLLPNLGALSSWQHRRARPLRVRSFLGVGVSDYQGTEWASLPGAAEEPAALAPLTQASRQTCFKDGQARAAHVTRALEEAEWAHFACHGQFQPEAPHRSCLQLGADGTGASSLSLLEISSLRLERLRLAVLASCWSSSASVLPGNELICIPAAFLRAGAGAVVAPLWAVNDSRVLPFMKRAYEEISRHGVAEGLARAQRDACQQSPSSGQSAVHVWGGYLAYGNG